MSNLLEEAMKTCLVVALIGAVISFAGPAFAQQKAVADTEMLAPLAAQGKGWDQAFIKGDAEAVLTL